MRFTRSKLEGVVVVDLDRLEDDRGFFARSWCAQEFAKAGLDPHLAQCNVSWNARRGTLRGLHWSVEPGAEAKLVRCTHGSILDVVVDIRPGSPTFRQWDAVELTRENRRALFIPVGFAHGFQTLEDDCEVFYQMSVPFVAGAARGARWDDAAFGIRWPIPGPILSPRDAAYPDFAPEPGA